MLLLIFCLSLLNRPTITIIDHTFLCKWPNLRNRQGVKYLIPPLYILYICVCVCVLTSCRFLCAVLPLIFSIQNSALPEGQRGRPWGAAARSCVCQHHAQCVSEFVTGMEPCSWPYSGENKYLTPCGFRKFGHQRNVWSIIVILGLF